MYFTPAVRVDTGRHERRRFDETPRNGTIGTIEGSPTVELPKTTPHIVLTRKETVANIEKVLGRSGGVYVCPFKLSQMMKYLQDKNNLEY